MIDITFIYSPKRRIDDATMDVYLDRYHNLRQAYPELILGFDLVSQEDMGRPLREFIEKFHTRNPDSKYFFHAGKLHIFWNFLNLCHTIWF